MADTLAALAPIAAGLAPTAVLAAGACVSPAQARQLADLLEPALAGLAHAREPAVRTLAQSLLVESGGAGRPELLLALQQATGAEQLALLQSLARLPSAPPRLVPALQRLLAEASAWPVRMWAARALGSAAVVLAEEPIALVRAAGANTPAVRAASPKKVSPGGGCDGRATVAN
jgi:hypothetical protein